MRRIVHDQRGVAAIEFGLVAGTLAFVMLNCTDAARFYVQRMQIENAARMGAQAAWNSCDVSKLPATTKCTGLNTAVTNAVQSTSLGTAVTVQGGSPTEGYYCVSSAGVLTLVSAVSAKPANCASVGSPTSQPGDYVKVSATFTYSPLFGGISVGSTLPTSITSTAMMRLQ